MIAIDGNNATALNNLAWIGGELGDPKALGYAERAVALAPNNPTVLDTYGMLLVKKGETDKGLSYLDRARKLAPQSAPVLDTYGMLLLKSGDAKKGIEYLKRASGLEPRRYDVRIKYAKALAQTGQKDLARKELEALQAIPEDFPVKSEIPALLKTL